MFSALKRYRDPDNVENMTSSQLRKYQLNELDLKILFYSNLKKVSAFIIIAALLVLLQAIIKRTWIIFFIDSGIILIFSFLYMVSRKQLWLVTSTKKVLLKIFIENGITEDPYESV